MPVSIVRPDIVIRVAQVKNSDADSRKNYKHQYFIFAVKPVEKFFAEIQMFHFLL